MPCDVESERFVNNSLHRATFRLWLITGIRKIPGLVYRCPTLANQLPLLRIPEHQAGHSDNIRAPKPGHPATFETHVLE